MNKKIIYLINDVLDKHPEYKNVIDTEEDEKTVRLTLDTIENKINVDDYDNFLTLHLYPNIPIVKCFLEKWNVLFVEGKKWIIIDDSYADGFEMDMDAYEDDFAFSRLNDKTYEYYANTYKETSIDLNNYEYSAYAMFPNDDSIENTGLENISTDLLLIEIKRRLSKDEIIKKLC